MLPYSSLTDAELITLLKNGNAAAYTIIYNRYFHALYVHAAQKLSNNHEAQDVVHELFAHLWNKKAELAIHTSLKGYLYQGIRNRILDLIAHQQVKDKYVNSLQGFLDRNVILPDYNIREKQLIELIDNGIASLPTKMREIFELSRKEALSHKQIAEQLNLSEQTVKKQVNNALRILRTKLSASLLLAL